VIVTLAWTAYSFGLFDRAATAYITRGLEETGRFEVWPLAIGRFIDSPFAGVGLTYTATWVPVFAEVITPHNGFIYIALSSGVVPLIFFVLFLTQAIWGAFRSVARGMSTPFQIPLLAYCLLTVQASNETFMTPWMVVTLTAATTAFYQARRTVRSERRLRAPMAGRPRFGVGPRHHTASY